MAQILSFLEEAHEFAICTRLNIRPCIDGSTFSCNNTVTGVLKHGIVIPIKKLKTKYIINIGAIPSPIISSPYNAQASAVVYIRLRKPPHAAINTPPAAAPH